MNSIEFSNNLNQYSTMLEAFAYNLTRDSEDAKDLFQETAFRAYKNLDKFKTGTNLKAWLFTIMRNVFINNYRQKTKANTIIDTSDNLYYINSGNIAISNKAESNILGEELTNMVASLDRGLKIPFLMHYQGFKYQEIADHLDLPLGTVKSRIFFARKELKEIVLSKYNGRPLR